MAPNTNTMYCNVVQISYELKVEATTQGCHKNVDLVTPIVIGSIPLFMDQPSLQTTISGQPGLGLFSVVQAVRDQQNAAMYPPSNGHPDDFNNFAPPPSFNPGYAAPYPPPMAPYDQRKNKITFAT